MTWFFISLIPPALWSASNFIDAFLIKRFYRDRGVGSLIMFSSLYAIFVLPIFWLINPNVIEIALGSKIILLIVGLLQFVGIILYLYALKDNETSVIVTLFQTIPVFGLILAYFFLGETLAWPKLLAAGIIIFGAAMVSINPKELANIRTAVRWRLVILMLGCCFIFGLTGVLFKFAAIGENFWVANFWDLVGTLLGGIFLFIFHKSYRQDFLSTFKGSAGKILGLDMVNEGLTLGGNLTLNYAFLLAPVALVQLANSYQALFAFFYGAILAVLLPKYFSEELDRSTLVYKITAVIITTIGTGILFSLSQNI